MSAVYSCRGMPTINRFFDSDAFYQGLMGPFGCLSGDTEFLTPAGWKRMDAYQQGDLVAQWEPDGATAWVRPIRYIAGPAVTLLSVRCAGFEMVLSADHRVVFFAGGSTFGNGSAGAINLLRKHFGGYGLSIPSHSGLAEDVGPGQGSPTTSYCLGAETTVSEVPALNEMQYCFEVPSHAFLARYKGKVFATGNSGKSSACVIKLADIGIRQAPGPDGIRRSRFAVIRNSYRQLEDTTIKTFFQWFSPHVHGTWRASAHEFTLKSLKAGPSEPAAEIEFMFRALDRPDQLANLLSTEYTGGWVNEGREVPWAIFEGLSGRVGRYPAIRDGGATWSGIIADTNPPDTESDWYRFFEERKGQDEAVEALAKVIPGMTRDRFSALFKQPGGRSAQAENLANLPVGYYQRLAAGKSKDWIKVYVDGLYGFTTDGKAVFPEYADAMHCPGDEALWPRLNRDVEVFRSWDFGLTPACVWSQITPDGRWHILDEMVSTRMGADGFSDEVRTHSGRAFRGCEFIDVGDEAGGQAAQTDEKTCFQILRAKGMMIVPAPQTLAIRLEGTRRPLNSLVGGRPQFVLHPRCKTLRRALQGGYHFRRIRVSGESYTSEPNKNTYSHVADALTYAGAWLFGAELRTYVGADDSSASRDEMMLADRTRSTLTGY